MKALARTKISAEIFTPTKLVTEVLSSVGELNLNNPEFSVLDPACGNGQFIMQILNNKFKELNKNKTLYDDPHDLALKETYGVDLMASNIADLIARIVFWKFFDIEIFEETSQPKPDLILTDYNTHDDFYWLMWHIANGGQFLRKYEYDNIGVTIRNHKTKWWTMEYYIHGGFHTSYTGGGFCKNFVVADGLKYDYEFDGKQPASETPDEEKYRISAERKLKQSQIVKDTLIF